MGPKDRATAGAPTFVVFDPRGEPQELGGRLIDLACAELQLERAPCSVTPLDDDVDLESVGVPFGSDRRVGGVGVHAQVADDEGHEEQVKGVQIPKKLRASVGDGQGAGDGQSQSATAPSRARESSRRVKRSKIASRCSSGIGSPWLSTWTMTRPARSPDAT